MERKLIFYSSGRKSQEINIPENISVTVPFFESKGYVMLVKGFSDIKEKNNELYKIYDNINLNFVSKIDYMVDGKVVVDIYPKFGFKKEYLITDELYFGRISDKNYLIYEIVNIYQDNGGTDR